MSQIAGAAVAHLARFPVAGLDASSLRCLAEIISESIGKHEAVAQTVPADCRAEFDGWFADDLAAARDALAGIKAELESRKPKETYGVAKI